MEIEAIKKLIKKYAPQHTEAAMRSEIAERYYQNKNDILFMEKSKESEEAESPLRNADNRIPSNFHGLLVNQKASYMFTAPPLFDVGEDSSNKRITGVLGDEYAKMCKDLCINASNSSVAWLHYWKNEKGEFEYGVVDSKQVIPIWTKSLKKKLIGILRIYPDIDDNGDEYIIYEYWTDKECEAFRRKSSDTVDEGLEEYTMFTTFIEDTQSSELSSLFSHDSEAVPFIPFFNNNINTDDLVNIKRLIDTYDKVFSGFVNDLEDIQEIIFILSGYGGTDLKEFVQDLKKYKAIKVDADEGSGVSALTINIPVEAREKLLTITRKAIFEQGQGVDTQPDSYGDKSGEALKFMYSVLELKAGLMQTEFELALGTFIKVICRYLGVKGDSITQTWTRTAIKSDSELAEIAQKSSGIISRRTIVKHHPWVEDPEKEMKQIEKEEASTEDDMLNQNKADLQAKVEQVSDNAEE
ncbi:MAG: phage portal protein family [Lachnospiraceae bacterium]|nr:phage portal protein family [Lachnospiraceae bacterium]